MRPTTPPLRAPTRQPPTLRARPAERRSPTETVTVSAEADRSVADPTAFATVIRASDYADRITTLPDLLRDAVGVQVKSLGGDFATVSIRGSSAEQVVVYLDGVPLNRALGGGVNLADIPLVQLDTIEIYRGVTPASLSMASIGGAILLHSRSPGPGAHGAASASYGSYSTAQVSGSYARGGANGDWLAAIDGTTSDGDFTYLDDNATPFDPTDDVEGPQGHQQLHPRPRAPARRPDQRAGEADVPRRPDGAGLRRAWRRRAAFGDAPPA